jgi:hypothetical protein
MEILKCARFWLVPDEETRRRLNCELADAAWLQRDDEPRRGCHGCRENLNRAPCSGRRRHDETQY